MALDEAVQGPYLVDRLTGLNCLCGYYLRLINLLEVENTRQQPKGSCR